MSKKFTFLLLVLFGAMAGCDKTGISDGSPSSITYSSTDGAAGAGGGGSQGGGASQPGVMTAGEWNDLDNWQFWDTTISKTTYKDLPAYWNIYNNKRISVSVMGTDALPVKDVVVRLKKNGVVAFSAKTDNKGKAELWMDLFTDNQDRNYAGYTIDINNGAAVISQIKPFSQGVNQATIPQVAATDKIEIAFTVDATGSMGDELRYLKTELLDVLNRIKTDNPTAIVNTSSVFYRDKGDEYLTRVSDFGTNINTTINFIKEQEADGGGDFPEAVHTALEKAVNDLQWSASAKTRLLFLVLDAPPHHEDAVMKSLQSSVLNAAQKGIKIIPITASGIDKETEFLMRFLAMSTNGTYVFITNDSGIGNDHLIPTVGKYTVEYLNNLMIRLINKYAK